MNQQNVAVEERENRTNTLTNTMITTFAIRGAICAVLSLSFGNILFAGG